MAGTRAITVTLQTTRIHAEHYSAALARLVQSFGQDGIGNAPVTVPRITESRQAMTRKTSKRPSRPDKNAESDAKGLQKKARLENDLEEGLEESFPDSDPPSASEPGI